MGIVLSTKNNALRKYVPPHSYVSEAFRAHNLFHHFAESKQKKFLTLGPHVVYSGWYHGGR